MKSSCALTEASANEQLQHQEQEAINHIMEYQINTPDEAELKKKAKDGMYNYLKFRDEYALIVFGNDVRFAHRYIDDDGNESFVVKKKNAVKDEWSDRKAFVQIQANRGEVNYIPVDVTFIALEGVSAISDITNYAKEHGVPMKRWQGVSFEPGKTTNISYNRFRGFPVTPKKGDVSPLLGFLEKAFGKEGMEVILTFFASMYQHPDTKLRWMLAIIGEKGLGKNTVEELLGKNLLYPENYMRAGNKEHLFGKFNAFSEANLLTVVQEVVWEGDPRLDSILKEWITESTRTIEIKYVDAYTVKNFSRILMTSNADWVVPASGRNERRYAVLRIKDIKYSADDWSYLYAWAQANRDAIMYYLMNYPLQENYHVKAPYTQELRNQLRQGLSGIESYVFDALSNGYFGKAKKYDRDIGEIYLTELGVPVKRMYESYMQTRDTKEKITLPEFSKKLLGANGSYRPLLSFNRKRSGKHKETTYFFDSRKECAEVFFKATGVNIPLPENDNEWHTGS